MAKGYYAEIDKFNKIINKFKRSGESYKYIDILKVIKEHTCFSKTKLNKELEELQKANICFYDEIDGIVHFNTPEGERGRVGEELSSFDRVISSTPIPPISSSAEKDKED